jgi:hypothetical protein
MCRAEPIRAHAELLLICGSIHGGGLGVAQRRLELPTGGARTAGHAEEAIAIRYFNADSMQWIDFEYLRGEVCATAADPDVCTFTFEWCDGEPPPPCE